MGNETSSPEDFVDVLPGLASPPTAEPLALRYYQLEAVASAYAYLRANKDNPCIVLPTGAGKTPVMASICNDAVSRWKGRVLVLSHVKELIQQTAETLATWFPGLNVGVYSAGLNRRDRRSDVLVAGIQSVHKRGLDLAGSRPFNIVLVDEAHRIPTSGDGMYRNLLTDLALASPTVRVIGLTATPYRLKGGYVCGPEHFLNAICHETGVRELIAKGYLCPLVSKQSANSVDASAFGVRNGEFKTEDVEEAFDNESVVDAAVAEIVAQTADRQSVLIFCCGIEHADHVSDRIALVSGQPCGMVTGETRKEERNRTIEAFKAGRLKYLANVNVLTEGFDARQVDCVCLLRSTLSPGLYYQMVGRGLRIHPQKYNCLVLDFGGNVLRHGCIDDIRIKTSKAGPETEPPARTCPQCHEIVNAALARCPACGLEFPRKDWKPNHEGEADEVPITSDQVSSVRYQITDTMYNEHIKRGADESAPRTMRVSYYDGVHVIADEWVCIEHGGWAGERAAQWWAKRSAVPMPESAAEAAELGNNGALAAALAIHVRRVPGSRFPEIVRHELGEIPDYDTSVRRDAFGEVIEERQPGWDDEELVEYEPFDLDEDIPF